MPALSAPAQGALIGALEQPITLTAQNPPGVPGSSLQYTFDVSLDPGFGSLVASQSVVQADGDRTSVTLAPLPGNTTYFWRVRATTASDTGLLTTSPAFFTIGRDIVSGPYEMAIDASGTSCGGVFAQPLRIEGNVTRTSANQFRFDRPPNSCVVDLHCGDRFSVYATITNSAFAGPVSENDTQMAAPTGYGMAGGYEYSVQGTVSAGGAITGVLRNAFGGTPGPTTIRLATSSPTFLTQSCTAPSFAWTLTPLP
jgi:hypothetical protein